MNSDNDAVGIAVEITVGIAVGILENFSDTHRLGIFKINITTNHKFTAVHVQLGPQKGQLFISP